VCPAPARVLPRSGLVALWPLLADGRGGDGDGARVELCVVGKAGLWFVE